MRSQKYCLELMGLEELVHDLVIRRGGEEVKEAVDPKDLTLQVKKGTIFVMCSSRTIYISFCGV